MRPEWDAVGIGFIAVMALITLVVVFWPALIVRVGVWLLRLVGVMP